MSPTSGQQNDTNDALVRSTQELQNRQQNLPPDSNGLFGPPADRQEKAIEVIEQTIAHVRRQEEAESEAHGETLRGIMGEKAAATKGIMEVRIEGDGPDKASNPGADMVGKMLQARVNAAYAVDEELNTKIVDFVRAYFEMSHERISERYDHWREAEIAHDVYVPAYVADRSAQRNASTTGASRRIKRPRIVDVIKVPYSRAISDTICTYNLAVFGGARPFTLSLTGKKGSRRGAKILEAGLAANMRRIGYEAKLYQMSLDQNRYGMGPMSIFFGADGNQIINVDPWNYFPDPRVTAQNRSESEFVGYRSWASLTALKRRNIYQRLSLLESGSVASFSWRCNTDTRDVIRGQSVDYVGRTSKRGAATEYKFARGDAHLLNTLFIFMDPQQLGIPAPFGLYRIVVANEKHVILFDKSPYPHGRIPVIHGDALYDAHKTFGSGAYDLMLPMQRFQDWLIRTRVENVQSIVMSRMIVDPTRININDILTPNSARLIRTLPGADPKSALLPVDIADATQRYWNDINMAGDLMQRLTAANDTAQGVQSETQRTATEISRMTSLGQQRLGMNARLISAMTVRPMVQQMVANTQYFSLDGGMVQLPPEFLEDRNGDGWIEWQIADVLGDYDYMVVDGTLPVSPVENTENLIRAIKALSETGLSAEFNMRMFVERLIESMGFDDIEEWKNDPATAAARAQGVMNAAQAMPNTQVIPNEVAMREAERGNIIPMSQAASAMRSPSSPTAATLPGAVPQPGGMI